MALDIGGGGSNQWQSYARSWIEEEKERLQNKGLLPLPTRTSTGIGAQVSGKFVPNDQWSRYTDSIQRIGGIQELNSRLLRVTTAWQRLVGGKPNANIVVDLALASPSADMAEVGVKRLASLWGISDGYAAPEQRAKMDYFLSRGIPIPNGTDPASKMVQEEWNLLRTNKMAWTNPELILPHLGFGKDKEDDAIRKFASLFDPLTTDNEQWIKDYQRRQELTGGTYVPKINDVPRAAALWSITESYPGIVLPYFTAPGALDKKASKDTAASASTLVRNIVDAVSSGTFSTASSAVTPAIVQPLPVVTEKLLQYFIPMKGMSTAEIAMKVDTDLNALFGKLMAPVGMAISKVPGGTQALVGAMHVESFLSLLSYVALSQFADHYQDPLRPMAREDAALGKHVPTEIWKPGKSSNVTWLANLDWAKAWQMTQLNEQGIAVDAVSLAMLDLGIDPEKYPTTYLLGTMVAYLPIDLGLAGLVKLPLKSTPARKLYKAGMDQAGLGNMWDYLARTSSPGKVSAATGITNRDILERLAKETDPKKIGEILADTADTTGVHIKPLDLGIKYRTDAAIMDAVSNLSSAGAPGVIKSAFTAPPVRNIPLDDASIVSSTRSAAMALGMDAEKSWGFVDRMIRADKYDRPGILYEMEAEGLGSNLIPKVSSMDVPGVGVVAPAKEDIYRLVLGEATPDDLARKLFPDRSQMEARQATAKAISEAVDSWDMKGLHDWWGGHRAEYGRERSGMIMAPDPHPDLSAPGAVEEISVVNKQRVKNALQMELDEAERTLAWMEAQGTMPFEGMSLMEKLPSFGYAELRRIGFTPGEIDLMRAEPASVRKVTSEFLKDNTRWTSKKNKMLRDYNSEVGPATEIVEPVDLSAKPGAASWKTVRQSKDTIEGRTYRWAQTKADPDGFVTEWTKQKTSYVRAKKSNDTIVINEISGSGDELLQSVNELMQYAAKNPGGPLRIDVASFLPETDRQALQKLGISTKRAMGPKQVENWLNSSTSKSFRSYVEKQLSDFDEIKLAGTAPSELANMYAELLNERKSLISNPDLRNQLAQQIKEASGGAITDDIIRNIEDSVFIQRDLTKTMPKGRDVRARAKEVTDSSPWINKYIDDLGRLEGLSPDAKDFGFISPLAFDAASTTASRLARWWYKVTGDKVFLKNLAELTNEERAAMGAYKMMAPEEYVAKVLGIVGEEGKVLAREDAEKYINFITSTLQDSADATRKYVFGATAGSTDSRLGYVGRVARNELLADIRSQWGQLSTMLSELRKVTNNLAQQGIKIGEADRILGAYEDVIAKMHPYQADESAARAATAGTSARATRAAEEGLRVVPGSEEVRSRIYALKQQLAKEEERPNRSVAPLWPYQSSQAYTTHIPLPLVQTYRNTPEKLLERLNKLGWDATDAGIIDQATSIWKRVTLASAGVMARILQDEPLRMLAEGYGWDALLSITRKTPANRAMESYVKYVADYLGIEDIPAVAWDEAAKTEIDWLSRQFSSSNYDVYIPKTTSPNLRQTKNYYTQAQHVLSTLSKQPAVREALEKGINKETMYKWATTTDYGRRFLAKERGATKYTMDAVAQEWAEQAERQIWEIVHTPSHSALHPQGWLTKEEEAAYEAWKAAGGSAKIGVRREVPFEWPKAPEGKALPDNVTQRQWYHGKSSRVEGGEYGPGVYLTDDASHAASKGTPYIVDVGWAEPNRLLDADVPLGSLGTNTIVRALSQIYDAVGPDLLKVMRDIVPEETTFAQFYEKMRKALAGRADTEELLAKFNNTLANDFDAIIRHDGGRNGMVVLDPQGIHTGRNKVYNLRAVDTPKVNIANEELAMLPNPIKLADGEEIRYGRVWRENTDMLEMMRSGRVTRKGLERMPSESLPVFAARREQITPGNKVLAAAMKPFDIVWDVFGSMMENVRRNIYAHAFNERIVDNITLANKLYDEGLMGHMPIFDPRQMWKNADEYARSTVKRMTYDNTRTTLEYSMRNVMPFMPATRDFLMYWGDYMLFQHPEMIMTMYRMEKLPDEMELYISRIIGHTIGAITGAVSQVVGGPDLTQRVEEATIDLLGDKKIRFNPLSMTFFTGGAGSKTPENAWDFISQQIPGLGPVLSYPARAVAAAIPDTVKWLKLIPGLELVDADIPVNSRGFKLWYGFTGIVTQFFDPSAWADFIKTGEFHLGRARPQNLPWIFGRNPQLLNQTMNTYIKAEAMMDDEIPWDNSDEAAEYLHRKASQRLASDKFWEGILSWGLPMSVTIEDAAKDDLEEACRTYTDTYTDWGNDVPLQLYGPRQKAVKEQQQTVRDKYPEYSDFFDYIDALHSQDKEKVENIAANEPGVVSFFVSQYDKIITRADSAKMRQEGIKEDTWEEWLWIYEHKLAIPKEPERYVEAQVSKQLDRVEYERYRSMEAKFQADVDAQGLIKGTKEYKDLRAKYDTEMAKANAAYEETTGREYYRSSAYYQLLSTDWEERLQQQKDEEELSTRRKIWSIYDNAVSSGDLTPYEEQRIALYRDESLKKQGLPLGRPDSLEPLTMAQKLAQNAEDFCRSDWHILTAEDMQARGFRITQQTELLVDEAFAQSQYLYEKAGRSLTTLYSSKMETERQAFNAYIAQLSAADPGFQDVWEWHMKQYWERLRDSAFSGMEPTTESQAAWQGWFNLLETRDSAIRSGKIVDSNGKPVTTFSLTDPSKAAKPLADILLEGANRLKQASPEFAEQFDEFPLSFWNYSRKW